MKIGTSDACIIPSVEASRRRFATLTVPTNKQHNPFPFAEPAFRGMKQPEEEESSAWRLRNVLWKNQPSKSNMQTQQQQQSQQQQQHAVTTATGSPPEIDRYRHDLAQAELMRRGMKKRREQRREGQLTEEDILLGLNGLDEADTLRERGELEKSLKISEAAMELLIQFLRSDPTVLPNISRDTISQRVHFALSDAEEIKRNLATRNASNGKTATTTTTTSPSEKSTASRGTSQALSNALENAVRKVQTNNGKQTAGQATSSGRTVSEPIYAHSSPKTPRRPATQVSSKFYNSEDPLVKTVKSDLYVDQTQLQDISWDDIAGLETAKQSLQENAILPMIRPDLFTGLRKPRNILLYGPPGTGKTLLVKAVAKESNCLLFICTASALTSKWHGEGEKLLRTLFQVARAAAPSIIFVDEMDALLSSRKSEGEHEASRRFKTEFMTQVDGIVQDSNTTSNNGKHLLLIACTNCPWDIDPAVMRRFPRRILIPLPDYKARKALLMKLLAKSGKHSLSATDCKSIVKRLSGFSGSDIAAIASEASFGPIRSLGGIDAIRGVDANKIRPISLQDFDIAIKQATKSVGKKQIQEYEDWEKENAATY